MSNHAVVHIESVEDKLASLRRVAGENPGHDASDSNFKASKTIAKILRGPGLRSPESGCHYKST